MDVRRLAVIGALVTVPVLALMPVRAATTPSSSSPSLPALGALAPWSASGATLQDITSDAQVGGGGTRATVTQPQWSMTAAPGRSATAGSLYGARGWIREFKAEGGVVQVRVAGAGWSAVSAPLHLGPSWQTFGVTTQVPAGGGGGTQLSIEPLAGASLPPGSDVDVAGVTAGPVSPTVVTRIAGTREIAVSQNGGPATAFDAQGYVYWPAQIGQNGLATTWADPTTCQADAQLLRGAGVTLLQVPYLLAQSPTDTPYLQCADSFWAAGIGLAWLLDEGDTVYPGPEWVDAYQQYVQKAETAFSAHPATYLWIIGNENDSQTYGPSCFFDNVGSACPDGQGDYVQTLATESHQLDPNHLVGTKLCCDLAVMSASDAPALDFWGIDSYQLSSFGSLFSFYVNQDPTRPVLMTEFGNTRTACFGASSYSVQSSGRVYDYACPPGSHEDPADQATGNAGLWQDILNNEATPSNPNGAVFGGTTFLYSDLWWYEFNDPFTPVGTDRTHEFDAWNIIGSYPPGNFWAWEWAGSTYAQDTALAGEPRVTTSAFGQVEQLWSPAVTYPTVSNLVVTPGDCQLTVTWTTPVDATSRVDDGAVQIVTLPDLSRVGQNDVWQDNTDYSQFTDSPALTTSHSVTVTGLSSATTYRLVARGSDSVGRTAASAPVEATTTSASCPLAAPPPAVSTASPSTIAAVDAAIAGDATRAAGAW
ncbi:MAG TPA: hypothetical protein VFC09_08335 [Candidatus Dormibacteraeota bacterium]|nr:hypothetical protein [Candidatus Dormibacteraeota bacterium]